MKTQLSKKHHYLPRNYLKGFTNDEGLFYVYDKKNDVIFDKPVNPASVFFEKNLNTLVFPNGEVSDIIEKHYTEMESSTNESLNRIRNVKDRGPIDKLDWAYLFYYLNELYWRLPCNIKHANTILKDFFEDERFKIFKLVHKNGKEVSRDYKSELTNNSIFKKTSKLMLMFAQLSNPNLDEKVNNWDIYNVYNIENPFIIGDNPIITSGVYDNDPEKCLDECFFPISSDKLFVSTYNSRKKHLTTDLIVYIGLSILHRAQRFIAGPELEYLILLIHDYKRIIFQKEEHLIVNKLFNMIRAD